MIGRDFVLRKIVKLASDIQSLKLIIPSHFLNDNNNRNNNFSTIEGTALEMQPACDNFLNLTSSSSSSNYQHQVGDELEWRNLTDLSSSGTAQNVNCLEHAPELTYSAYVKAIVLAVMAGLSLIANAATIYSIRKNRRKRQSCTAIYTLILHLSVADLLVTVFCIGGEALWSYTVAWIWGNAACKIFKFLQMWSLYLSTFILVLIGVDRLVAVRYPMKSLNTAQRCSRLVLFTWVLSFVLSIPQLVVFHVASGPFVEEFWQCVTHGFYTEPWQEQLYTTLSLIFMFLLPLVILIATYVSTVVTIARSERVFKTELASNNTNHISGDLNRRRLMHRAKSKSLRISVVIVAAFVLWWTPYYTMMIIFMFLNPDKHMSQDLQSGIFFFGMSNSLVNPLIYGAFHLWPQRRRRQGSHCRDGSTMQHRSTTTNASFMLLPRGSSARLVRQTTRNSNLGLSVNGGNNNIINNINNNNHHHNRVSSQTPEDTSLLVELIQNDNNIQHNNQVNNCRLHNYNNEKSNNQPPLSAHQRPRSVIDKTRSALIFKYKNNPNGNPGNPTAGMNGNGLNTQENVDKKILIKDNH